MKSINRWWDSESSNPSEMPEQTVVDKVREPFVKATISAPNDYVGPVMELCQSKRGGIHYNGNI